MGRHIALALMVLTFAAVARSSAEDQSKPQWRDSSNTLTIFGNVEQPGFYVITDHPMSLAQLVTSAGLRPGKGIVVILQRPAGKGAKTILVDADRLTEDGDIPLQANDVIQVTAPKAG